jgi:hypothetical protein
MMPTNAPVGLTAAWSVKRTITPPRPFDPDAVHRYSNLGVRRLVVKPPTMEGTAWTSSST